MLRSVFCLALALVHAPADAGEVWTTFGAISGGMMGPDLLYLGVSFAAFDGEANDVSVTFAEDGTGGWLLTITDAHPIVSSACPMGSSPNEVVCAIVGTDGLQVQVDLKDGNDDLDVHDQLTAVPAVLALSATGGHGRDVMQGDGLIPSTLEGGPGRDLLAAGAAGDVLRGGDGVDQLFGGSGDDDLDGGPDSDTLEGRSGNDTLVGGWGPDVMWGGRGADTLISADGGYVDSVHCGFDSVTDSVTADGADSVSFCP